MSNRRPDIHGKSLNTENKHWINQVENSNLQETNSAGRRKQKSLRISSSLKFRKKWIHFTLFLPVTHNATSHLPLDSERWTKGGKGPQDSNTNPVGSFLWFSFLPCIQLEVSEVWNLEIPTWKSHTYTCLNKSRRSRKVLPTMTKTFSLSVLVANTRRAAIPKQALQTLNSLVRGYVPTSFPFK